MQGKLYVLISLVILTGVSCWWLVVHHPVDASDLSEVNSPQGSSNKGAKLRHGLATDGQSSDLDHLAGKPSSMPGLAPARLAPASLETHNETTYSNNQLGQNTAKTVATSAHSKADNVPLRSTSERMAQKIKNAMEEVLSMLQKAELARAAYELKELEQFSMAKVTLAHPSEAEMSIFGEKIRQEAQKLGPEERPFFITDSQRLLDSFCHFRSPLGREETSHLVVFVRLRHAVTVQNEAVIYWEFFTNTPGLFASSDDGTVKTPPGIPNYYSKPWYGLDWLPSPRYRHLFSGF